MANPIDPEDQRRIQSRRNLQRVYFASLGCARNLIDSETMMGRLDAAGWQLTSLPQEAEVIVVNTCSFIETAAQESVDAILELAEFKKDGCCKKLIVAGCLPERYGESIKEALPEVDFFLGTGAFDQIINAVEGQIQTGACLLPDPGENPFFSADTPRIRSTPHTAYVKIAEGCSKGCTYCIIPKLRGAYRSRPSEEIFNECKTLVRQGVQELVLVAQDTTAYGRDLNAGGLESLLASLAGIDPKIWVRFLYGNPESITVPVIRTVAQHPNICSYFDIPIQHAAAGVLKRMGRHYDPEKLYRLFDTIRKEVPGAVLRTTLIVGFPGETDEDFESLVSFVESVRFDLLGVFTYSDAEDLPAHRLADPVPASLARKRHDRMMKLQQKISGAGNQRYIGSLQTVLIEENTEPGLYVGRTAFQAPEVDGLVYVHGKDLTPGEFFEVRITDALEYDLVGEAI